MLDVQAYTWFAKAVAVGELLIGVALILGLFTGLAAFFGGFLNWNFMMAGTASTNPLLFAIAVLLILAWKVAGYYGLDRYVLPALGTPWQAGTLGGGRPPRRPRRPGAARSAGRHAPPQTRSAAGRAGTGARVWPPRPGRTRRLGVADPPPAPSHHRRPRSGDRPHGTSERTGGRRRRR